MYQGATLSGAIVDLLECDHKPQNADMMAGYVGSSRVKQKETVLFGQPFSLAIFCLGPPIGPTILMRVLRGELPADHADAEFDRLEEEQKSRGTERELMKMHWPCRACRAAGREDFMQPMHDFGVRSPADFLNRLLPQGAWARCVQCSRARKGALGAALGLH